MFVPRRSRYIAQTLAGVRGAMKRMWLLGACLMVANAVAAVPPKPNAVSVKNNSADIDISMNADEQEKTNALQQLAEIWGNWEVVEDSQSADDEKNLIGDIWTFNQDASFLSRAQGQRRGDAHFNLAQGQLEISQTASRRQFQVLSVDDQQMRLRYLQRYAETLGDDDAQPKKPRELVFRRSETPAGSEPASIYYTPRQVAKMQVMLTCGFLHSSQLEQLFSADESAEAKPQAPVDAGKSPATATERIHREIIKKKDPEFARAFRHFEKRQQVASDSEQSRLAQTRQQLDDYIFNHVGIRHFDWSVYQASKQYYDADLVYTSVFPGIIHREIRRCLH